MIQRQVNRKMWLDELYYHLGNQRYDFFVCGLQKEGDEVKATKWKKYSEVCFPLNPWEDDKLAWVNQRQILPNEVVLDIEDKDQIDGILRKLKEIAIANYYVYDTGSKGYHIHIFSTLPVTQEVKEFFCKLFGSDILKSGEKTMIALEFAPHWKTGRIKTLIEKWK